jgi:hypothetical protein
MEKLYERINFENAPSKKTPLSAENLNKIDSAINAIDNRVIETHDELKSDLGESYSELKETIDTNIKNRLIGFTETQYFVDNGIISNDNTIKGLYFPVKKNVTYLVSVKGSHNRFIINGIVGEVKFGTNATRIISDGTIAQYQFTNNEYDYILVTLNYGATEYDAICSVVEDYTSGDTFMVGGEELYRKQALDNLLTNTENLIVTPTISTYFNENDYVSRDDENVKSLYFPVKKNVTYKMTVYSAHNRFILSGIVNNIAFGASAVNIVNDPTLSEYQFYNTEYDYLLLVLNYGADFNYDFSILENYNDNGFSKDDSFSLDFSTIKSIANINELGKRLCLVAVKQIHSNGKMPDVDGYLYLERESNKLYYSSPLPDNPQYLCEWNESIAESAIGSLDSKYKSPRFWHFYITADGDIVCLLNYFRANPIIYPNGNYANPVIVNGLSVKPYGTLNNLGMVQFDDGSFVFGEYTTHKESDQESNDRRNIWKVTKPYTNPSNWVIEHSFKHVFYENGESDEPTNEIGHIHSVTYDFYDDMIYANTGDLDRHCRIWRKPRTGTSDKWFECANGRNYVDDIFSMNDQRIRMVNLIFTKDYCIYATDSFREMHNIWKATRDENGHIDFGTLTKVCNVETFAERDENNTQATYGNVLLRNPNGLLMIDRSEDRTDHKLDVVFYSFDTKRLYKCYTFEKVGSDEPLYWTGDKGGMADRVGLCNQVIVTYQPSTTDCIMIGGADYVRINDTTVFDNDINNYVGALKLKIVS